MSADNGWIIREVAEPEHVYVLQMYFASADDYPPIEKGLKFNTLDEAVRAFEKAESEAGYPSEYGLSIELIKSVTTDQLVELIDTLDRGSVTIR